MTKTNKIKAVKKVFALVKNGATLTDARAIIANDLNVSSATVANWPTTLASNTTTTTTGTDTKTTLHTDYSFEDMSGGVRGVLRSIINQDGQYSIKEAKSLGYSINEILNMNYDIDHIIPISYYSLPEEIKKCYNPLNLRWLPSSENRSRGNKLREEDMEIIKTLPRSIYPKEKKIKEDKC